MPADRLTPAQIQAALASAPGWTLKGGIEIAKQYTFKDFAEAMRFVNRVAALAETADHHPDITIRYRRVILALSTHDAGGLTDKDFALARQIEGAAHGA